MSRARSIEKAIRGFVRERVIPFEVTAEVMAGSPAEYAKKYGLNCTYWPSQARGARYEFSYGAPAIDECRTEDGKLIFHVLHRCTGYSSAEREAALAGPLIHSEFR